MLFFSWNYIYIYIYKSNVLTWEASRLYRWQKCPMIKNVAPKICSLQEYVYIYIYWQHFSINTYFIEHNKHFLSTYFFVNPYKLPYWSYDIRRELVDKSSIISYFPSTSCTTLSHHLGRMYYKSDVTFSCTLQHHYHNQSVSSAGIPLTFFRHRP